MTLAAIPIEFFVFAAMLGGIAMFHRQSLLVALLGLGALLAYALTLGQLRDGWAALLTHLEAQWVTLANLFALLVGFAVLARQFEISQLPRVLARYLPQDWRGALLLLLLVFVMSSFLDNIAAAAIGGAMAAAVFQGRVRVGYLAAIVAAANAGGCGSVIGDTTSTMMWIDGVKPAELLRAYVAASVAFVCFAIPASIRQQRFAPIVRASDTDAGVDWLRLACIAVTLAAVIFTNALLSGRAAANQEQFPYLGAALWGVMLLTVPVRRPQWKVLAPAARNALFLVALIISASLLPLNALPSPSWPSTFGLGFISAVFDNIPLTKLALLQGGYDFALLAFAVGFGGSMIWFGSSAGVAIASEFPEARSVGAWIRESWYIAPAYIAGFFVMLLLYGWQPLAA